jgi:outer membrane biogenesis lipoprotein LolB
MLCAGCSVARRVGPHPAPSTLPSAAQLNAALHARHDAVQSLRALGHLGYRDPRESNTSRQAIIVARPDRVRIEVLSVFGTVFVLTAEDGAMTAYARQENTVYRGRASAANLQRYARLWIPLDDLIDLLLGTPPARRAVQERVSFDPQVGAVRLWRGLDDGAQVIWFSEAALPLAAEELKADGSARWHAAYGSYVEHGGVPIATDIRLELPAQERTLQLTLEDVDVNPALDQSIFALQAPPGSKIVNLDSLTD